MILAIEMTAILTSLVVFLLVIILLAGSIKECFLVLATDYRGIRF